MRKKKKITSFIELELLLFWLKYWISQGNGTEKRKLGKLCRQLITLRPLRQKFRNTANHKV